MSEVKLSEQDELNQATNQLNAAADMEAKAKGIFLKYGKPVPASAMLVGNQKSTPTQRDADVELFIRSTQTELKDLSLNDPIAFARVMESVRVAGELRVLNQR